MNHMLFKEGWRKGVGAAANVKLVAMNGLCQGSWEPMGGMEAAAVEATCGLQDHSGGAPAPHSGDHHHGLDTLRPPPSHHHRRRHLGNDFLLDD